MKILLLNQTFYPDVTATGQYLSQVALALARGGHQVTVVAGRRAYDDSQMLFPKTEIWQGIRIYRVSSTHFGKSSKWRRAADFASFIVSCCARLALVPKCDVVMALTTPPLISFIGAWLARIRGARFCYWVMDFNPDEAIAAGWLQANSLAGRVLDQMSRFSLRQAGRIIALDSFMRDRIVAKGIAAEKITVLPPWSQDSQVRFDLEGRIRFRKAHGLEDKFVVMYAGNHSPCHPLETVLVAAKNLAENREVVFLFIGGGSQFGRVREFAADHGLTNIVCLPYQPMAQLSASLSAADLHLVVMGHPFVGLVHPCKIYNILRVGSPLLYIGPKPSHVTEILQECGGLPSGRAEHGDVHQVIQIILRIKDTASHRPREDGPLLSQRFSEETLLPRLVRILESVADKQRHSEEFVGRFQPDEHL
jgi:colanic acid biosynthesis glycosyl transferase WcaI